VEGPCVVGPGAAPVAGGKPHPPRQAGAEERVDIDENTEPSAISQASNWRRWQVNLTSGTGAPVEGLDWMAGGYYAFRFGDRTFLLLPSGDYATTTAYELGKDGKATERFTVPGWAYQLVQIR